MFEELTNQFEDAVKAFKGEAKISEENVDEALKQVRRALLEADVSLSVVKEFIEEVREKSIGTEVVRGVSINIKKGEVFSEKNITTKRPALGINPMNWKKTLGRKAKKNYYKDDFI